MSSGPSVDGDGGVVAPAVDIGELDASAASLDQALNAYGACLGEQLNAQLRFRADRFAGVIDELSLRAGSTDQGLVQRERDRCGTKVGLDAIVATAQSERPLQPEQSQEIADEYAACVAAGAPELAGQISATPMATLEDVDASYGELAAGAVGGQLDVLNSCRDEAVFGPAISFGAVSG